MLNKNYVEVPATMEEDMNKGLTRWVDGKYVSIDEGTHVTLYIGHVTETITDEEGEERTVVRAFPVRVESPVSRDAAINAAEMEAYGLRTAMEVASFAASIARKGRINPSDPEVTEHDEFIAWVKEELTGIGV
jgi:hypothetical protein